MRRFHTGLICIDRHPLPWRTRTGRGWRVGFLITPGNVYPVSYTSSVDRRGRERLMVRAKEIIVSARSPEVALEAVGMIRQAQVVLDGAAFFMNSEPALFPDPDPTMAALTLEGFLKHNSIAANGFPLACEVATKASKTRRLSYALAKLSLSMELVAVHHRQLEPAAGPILRRSHLPADHVRFAQAIVLAHATVEELGLEVRASRERPSFLSDGQWSPPVRADLEARLQGAGIDLGRLYLWHQRGRVSRLEKKRRPTAVQRAPWFRSRLDVRDIRTHVVDAIAKLDWLRDKIAAHALRDAHLLTPYDVANAQGIARRLLLETMRSLPLPGRRRRVPVTTSGVTSSS